MGLALSSCVPSTPQARIEANPDIFNRLSDKDKTLVSKGEIEKGMEKDAVYLAWGKADRSADYFKNNRRSSRWDYTQLAPVYSNSFRGSFGYGYGGYGHRGRYYNRGYYGYGDRFGFGTSIYYRPEVAASVIFENEKVTAWKIER